jgi:hypothetical protein
MKKILLKELPAEGNMPMIKTVDLIKGCLNQTPEHGYTFDELMKRQRVDEALNGVSETDNYFMLEDQDYETLKKCALSNRWAVRHPFIIDFITSNFL